MATDEQRRSFGDALAAAMKDSDISQVELAAKVGADMGRKPISQPWLSEIRRGVKEPSVEVAFSLERCLGVKPGSLSRLLGYLPEEAVTTRSVPAAVEADPSLDEVGRRAVLAVWDSVRRPRRRQGVAGAR